MSTATERDYSCKEVAELLLEVVREPGAYVAQLIAARTQDVRKELWDLNRIQNRAQDSLGRPFDLFPGEHSVAKTFLAVDLPRKRQRLVAELFILDFASDEMRRDFVLSDTTGKRLIDRVITKGGIYHKRFDRRPVWVELVV